MPMSPRLMRPIPKVSAGITPASFAGLTIWFKADALVGFNNGDPITAWNSSSPATLNVISGGTPPTYSTNVVNGKPAAAFNGSQQLQTASTIVGSTIVGATAATTFYVFQVSGSHANFNKLNSWDNGQNNQNDYGCWAPYTEIRHDHGSYLTGGQETVATPDGWNDVPHLLVLRRSGTAGLIRADGVNLVSGASQFSEDLDNTQSAQFLLGAEYDGNRLVGWLAEMVTYNVALLDADIAKLEANYFNPKYFP